jgi:hypothetical protein
VRIETRALKIDPLLLNGGDGFKLKALVKDFVGPVKIDPPRIADVTRIIDATIPKRSWAQAVAPFVAGVVATAGIGASIPGIIKILEEPSNKSGNTVVTVRSGETFCGDLVRSNAREVVLKISGKDRRFQAAEVASTRGDTC